MRGIVAIVALLLLAACGTTGQPAAANRSAAFESKVDDAVDWSEEELIDYLTELTATRLTEVCSGRLTIRTQRECLRDALYQGFDADGRAREHCDALQDMSQFGRCVVIGTLVHETLTRAGMLDKVDFDWTAEEAELDQLGSEVGAFLAQSCLEEDPSAIDSCLLDNLARTFGATAGISDACYRIERTEEAGYCLLRVSFVERFETAVKRMGRAGDVSA
jgi:hypothetical protein